MYWSLHLRTYRCSNTVEQFRFVEQSRMKKYKFIQIANNMLWWGRSCHAIFGGSQHLSLTFVLYFQEKKIFIIFCLSDFWDRFIWTFNSIYLIILLPFALINPFAYREMFPGKWSTFILIWYRIKVSIII